ncbi:HD-GYP domain-containing protein [Ideonella sp.]|uniref:HD-GYP domain-containing protein n=1 Tax=Ideonella sp. TaxID=1929293 RepID=UPI002B46A99B|nr:HD domain-containing phosphohydrolase [Ideonella sp.]HJV68052.1 HD domain-containing phosphohydrolase [Ideonella sp.]
MGAAQRAPLVTVRDLIVVGQPLPFHVHDAYGRRLLAAGQVLTGDTQLDMLLERGAWVDQEEAAVVRRDRRAAQAGGGAPLVSTYREPTLFDRWEKLIWELDALLRKVIAGLPCAPELEVLGRQLITQVERDVDVALFVTIRPSDQRFALYALSHALHAATVAVVLARQLGWGPEQQLRLVLGALTMNVSILELQAQMAAQQDPPTGRQKQIIRAHPEASAALLQAAGVADAEWLTMVKEHHERADGTGYPQGLKGLSDMAHALRTVDVFTAKISPRAFRPALPVQAAARQLFQEEQGGQLAAGMIKALGLYPPGDLVQLKNGEIAVVARRGASATTPLVASLTNTAGQPIAATAHRDTAQPEFAIAGPAVERKGLSRVLPERVYGLMD